MPVVKYECDSSAFYRIIKQEVEVKELDKVSRFFRGSDSETKPLGVRFGRVFQIAKEHIEMPLDEVERLLEVRIETVSNLTFEERKRRLSKPT